MRFAAKVDANQDEIVRVLRACGASVDVKTSRVGGGFPDLVVGFCGKTYLMEVKTERGKLNALQRKWHSLWNGHAAVVRTPEDALRVIGAI